MNSKSGVLLALGMLIVAVVSAMAVLRNGNQINAAQATQEKATPVKEGVVTEKQKQHGRLYKDYTGVGKKLRELVQEEIQKGSNNEVGIAMLPGTPELSSDSYSSAGIPKEIVASADAIVVGVVKNKASQLTENGTFIFTDYGVSVEEVLKDNVSARIEPTNEITVTRPGGRILLNGRIVTAVDKSTLPLTVGGRYVLLLKFIPTTGAYQASGSKSGFQISNDKIIKLTEGADGVGFQVNSDAASFLNEVRVANAVSDREREKQ